MRLLDVFQKPDYEPHERGGAFPQFHEDGDKYQWSSSMDWGYHFWLQGLWQMETPRDNTFDPMWLMGGEL
jgi:hypothetical protein